MNFDYNLLKVLAVILETRNTTTAAERLCTSQPAVSRSLRKIRDLFNDDILVRKGTNMELTPKAEEIKAQLSGIINGIDKLVNVSHSFDPATESRVLRVAINSSIAQWFSAAFTQLLAKEAPCMNLVIEDWTETTPDKSMRVKSLLVLTISLWSCRSIWFRKKAGGTTLLWPAARRIRMVANACIWMTFQSTRTRFTSSNIGMKKKITSRAYYSLFQLSQEFNCVPRTSTLF